VVAENYTNDKLADACCRVYLSAKPLFSGYALIVRRQIAQCNTDLPAFFVQNGSLVGLNLGIGKNALCVAEAVLSRGEESASRLVEFRTKNTLRQLERSLLGSSPS